MKGATRAMAAMNRRMNMPALSKIMREFERQNERMEMTSEMMGDAVDDVFEGEGEEEETEELVSQVGGQDTPASPGLAVGGRARPRRGAARARAALRCDARLIASGLPAAG